MHYDATRITDYLRYAAPEHCEEKSPRSPSNSLIDMKHQADSKDRDEDGIGWQGRAILEDTSLDGTIGQCAIFIRTVRDVVGRVVGRHLCRPLLAAGENERSLVLRKGILIAF